MSDSATPWNVARQALLSMGFSRGEYCSGCHFLLQGIFLTLGLNLSLFCLLQNFPNVPEKNVPLVFFQEGR